MRASLWIAVASLFAVSSVGCGGGKRDGAAAVATTGALVGSVLELEGAVTATRGGATRPLAVGDRVHDDDVIATGTGRVAIKLDRNQVVWRLGPRLNQQVAQSSAWSAPTATANTVATTDEHSAAAGRHAEREAADTAASAVDTATRSPAAQAPQAAAAVPRDTAADAPKPMSKGAPPAPPTPAADPMPAPAPPPAPPPPNLTAAEPNLDDALPDPVTTKVESARGGAAMTGGVPDTDGDTAAATRSAKVAVPIEELRVAPPSGGGDVGVPSVGHTAAVGTIRVSSGLSASSATTRVRARQRQLAACGKGAAVGSYRVVITVGADGKVTAVDVANAAPALATCARDALKDVRFATAKTAGKVTVALTIK